MQPATAEHILWNTVGKLEAMSLFTKLLIFTNKIHSIFEIGISQRMGLLGTTSLGVHTLFASNFDDFV